MCCIYGVCWMCCAHCAPNVLHVRCVCVCAAYAAHMRCVPNVLHVRCVLRALHTQHGPDVLRMRRVMDALCAL